MPHSKKCASSQLYALTRTMYLIGDGDATNDFAQLHHQLNQPLFELISNIRIGIKNVMVSTLTWICFFLFNMPSKATAAIMNLWLSSMIPRVLPRNTCLLIQ